MKISIVISNPRDHERLKVLLECLFSQDLPRGDYEVLVVSEFPEADLKVFLKSQFGKIKNWKYFWSGRVGLSAVKNTAIDRAQGDQIWFLSDTCLPKDNQILKRILNRFESEPEVAGLGGTLKYLRREDPLSQAWFKLRRQRLHRAYYFDREGETRLIWPEHSLFRKNLFSAQLRFSESLDEDSAQIELCQRLTEKGQRLFLDPELELSHQPRIRVKKFITSAQNLARYFVSKMKSNPEILPYLRPELEFSPESRVRMFNALYVYVWSRFLLSGKKLWAPRWIFEDLKALIWLCYRSLYRLELSEGPRSLSPSPRAYSLDLNLTEHPNCAYCLSLKSNQYGLGLSLDQQLEQAAFYQFQMLALPCSFFSEVADFDILETILERGFVPLVRLRPQDFSLNRMKSLQPLSYSGCRFEVLASQSFEDNQKLLETLREVRAEFDLSFSLSYPSSLQQISRLPQWAIDRIQFLPNLNEKLSEKISEKISDKKNPLSRTRKDLALIRRAVAREGKRIIIQSPKAYELAPIKSGSPTPLGQIEQISHLDHSNIQISVLIPVKKITDETKLLLKSFIHQNFDKKHFEILFLQAGQEPLTTQDLKAWALETSEKINISLVTSRTAEVNTGSLCNLGARYAKGSFLNFIEPDLLVPNNYLYQLSEDLKHHDLVQCPEGFLSPEVAARLRYSAELDFGNEGLRGTKKTEEFKKSESWIHLKNYWIYTSCSSLILKKDLFLKLGGFKTNLPNRDFEAMDFGYRMHKAGLRFSKASVEVIHLSKNSKTSDSDLIQASLAFYKNFPEDLVAHEFATWLPGIGLPQAFIFDCLRQLVQTFNKIKLRILGQTKDFDLSKARELARFGK